MTAGKMDRVSVLAASVGASGACSTGRDLRKSRAPAHVDNRTDNESF